MSAPGRPKREYRSAQHEGTAASPLADKVAMVTGAGSGIGRDIALALARAGARVAICDLGLDGANETAGLIRHAGGVAEAQQADVTDEAAVEGFVADTIRTLGGVDILVSNAGIQTLGEIVDFTFADWKRMLATHLDGAFLATRACLKHMYANGRGGSIIYLGSVHSKEASRLKGPYVVAKHGVLGLCRAVAKEGGRHKVRANVICPGFVMTGMVTQQFATLARDQGISEEEVVSRVLEATTVDGELTLTSDVAEVAVFLAGFPTMALTGQSIVVSHGWHMS
jgi:3-hydroxybutyrate dehydrogenase